VSTIITQFSYYFRLAAAVEYAPVIDTWKKLYPCGGFFSVAETGKPQQGIQHNTFRAASAFVRKAAEAVKTAGFDNEKPLRSPDHLNFRKSISGVRFYRCRLPVRLFILDP
jgi:hypothetical protein